ncbi:MAG TPA: YkvA family protein [Anaerolineaceae bacterium]|jgi:uncharacterized membrane protein YkvA (DUF1232 family)|nr:YkvA family protein [Anaerolineaceae bacterium]
MDGKNAIEKTTAEKLSFFTTPLTARGWPRWLVLAVAALGLIYVINPTLGLLEFIPDTFPIVGNLDEGAAFLLIWYGLLELVEGRKSPQAPTEPPASPGPQE